jgi:hypothetical protein
VRWMEEEVTIEELERMLQELEEKEKQKRELIVPVMPQALVSTAVSTVNEEREPSFAELAEEFEKLAGKLDFIEKAMTKGFCYHVKLPFTKEEAYATVCRRHYADIYHLHPLEENTVKLLTDLLFKYYKHAAVAVQAIDELEECDSYAYPVLYHVVMFTDPVRLAVLFSSSADLIYVFKLQDGEYPEIIRIIVDINGKPRLRSMCKVVNEHDVYAIVQNILDALEMPLLEDGDTQ